MKKVFFDNLPKEKRGYIDWKNTVGYSFKFIYGDLQGDITITKYYVLENKRPIVTLSYNNKVKDMWIGDLQRGKIAAFLGYRNIDYIYKVGDIVNNLKNGRLEIINQTRIAVKGKNNKIRKLKGYIYKCQICNDVKEKTEDEMKKNGCSVCAGNEILKGYNDLWTVRPDIAKLLKNPERGYLVGKGSGSNKEIFICPDCGYEKSQILNNACKQGFSCNNCGDGISYPEKVMYRVLSQLKINFEKGKVFSWSRKCLHENKKLSGKKIYDFYVPSLRCIIETHGEQHYRYCGFDKTLEEEQENDRVKEQLAKENGIENYIVIDCRKSEISWIKNNIVNSKISKLFDLDSIDWEACDAYGQSSFVKTACDLYNKGLGVKEIAAQMGLSRYPIGQYLKRGVQIGWCDYDPIKSSVDGIKKMQKLNRREIIQLTKNGTFIKEWDSTISASVALKTSTSNISSVLKKRSISAGGYRWMYKEDYEKYIQQQNGENLHKVLV